MRSGATPAQALRAYASSIGRGFSMSAKLRYVFKALAEIEEERSRGVTPFGSFVS
jgi:hypothetical protein